MTALTSLLAVEAAGERATPGKWKVSCGPNHCALEAGGGWIAPSEDLNYDDAAYIAALVNWHREYGAQVREALVQFAALHEAATIACDHWDANCEAGREVHLGMATHLRGVRAVLTESAALATHQEPRNED